MDAVRVKANDQIKLKLKKRLEAERARLQAELAHINTIISSEEAAGAHAGLGNHMADDASDVFEQEKNLTLQRNLTELLQRVDHALSKIANNTYGRCDECGGEIGLARLQALPYANLCIECKTRLEKARA
jgi:DnaK suppressor protein